MRMVPLRALLITQYYKPELIGSAPFCADLAEWLNQHGRRTTVLTGLPHYPRAEVFPDYRKRRCKQEIINGVAVERVRNWIPRHRSAPYRIASELAFARSEERRVGKECR